MDDQVTNIKPETHSFGDADTHDTKTASFHDFSVNLEGQIVRLQHSLDSWKEIVLPIHSVLMWEKDWHPAAIVGGTTFIFLSLWLLDPSILTTISILGLTITISDYLVPTVAAALFKSEAWTPAKNNAYADFCRNVIICKERIGIWFASFYLMRTTKPKMFYGCTTVALAVFAWIGNSFNNLFLTYMLVTGLLLLPGMDNRGLLKKITSAVSSKITECAKLKTGQVKTD